MRNTKQIIIINPRAAQVKQLTISRARRGVRGTFWQYLPYKIQRTQAPRYVPTYAQGEVCWAGVSACFFKVQYPKGAEREPIIYSAILRPHCLSIFLSFRPIRLSGALS